MELSDVLQLIVVTVILLAISMFLYDRQPEKSAEAVVAPPWAGEWPADLPPLEDYARGVFERGLLPVTFVMPDRTLQPEDVKATYVGKVRVLGRGEPWPQAKSGEPLVGLGQFNLTEAPHVPEQLRGLALVSVFMQLKNPFEIVVRGYPSLEDLVPATGAPEPPDHFHPCGARMVEGKDYPGLWNEVFEEQSRRGLPIQWAYHVETKLRELEEAMALPPAQRWGPKIGGWGGPVQDPHEEPIALQIGGEDEATMNLVDGGCVYVWRSTAEGWEEWRTDFQFY